MSGIDQAIGCCLSVTYVRYSVRWGVNKAKRGKGTTAMNDSPISAQHGIKVGP